MKKYAVPFLAISLSACATVQSAYEVETQTVAASAETTPMDGIGDLADDPAIWVHPGAPERSLILGTNKENGLYIYDLSGTRIDALMVGRLNNVDLRGNIAVASNDGVNGLSWFTIDPDSLGVEHMGNTPTQKDEPYGACAGLFGGEMIAVATYKDGTVQIWSDAEKSDEGLSSELVRTIKLPSKLEGCVIDDAHQRMFVGEEAQGVWAVDLNEPHNAPYLIDTIAAKNGLVEDVEGMSIWAAEDGSGYLIVSAQEADRYVVYDRQPPFAPLGVFEISQSTDGTVDGVTHTDGLDVTSAPLPGYPSGLLVVQDDANPVSEENQNFKLVDWKSILSIMKK